MQTSKLASNETSISLILIQNAIVESVARRIDLQHPKPHEIEQNLLERQAGDHQSGPQK